MPLCKNTINKKPKQKVILFFESVAIMNANTDNCLQTNRPPKGKKGNSVFTLSPRGEGGTI